MTYRRFLKLAQKQVLEEGWWLSPTGMKNAAMLLRAFDLCKFLPIRFVP